MVNFRHIKFFTIIFILIISMNFVMASDGADDNSIIAQES